MTLTDVLGVAGFVIAAPHAVIAIRNEFLRKSRFKAFIVWATATSGPSLEISIANVGYKKNSIRAITFRVPASGENGEEGWLEWEVAGRTVPMLPVVLNVDEATSVIEYPISKLPRGLDARILNGDAQLLVTNAGGRESVFPVQPFPKRPR